MPSQRMLVPSLQQMPLLVSFGVSGSVMLTVAKSDHSPGAAKDMLASESKSSVERVVRTAVGLEAVLMAAWDCIRFANPLPEALQIRRLRAGPLP
ncbi:hypothetical protein BCCGELA001_30500 [Bradyrhizobium sp. CCGE-LA001]|nr:hypothetical protein BCCGELA001_30500 [Bradyrhizobium sp. CCGE-LA001]